MSYKIPLLSILVICTTLFLMNMNTDPLEKMQTAEQLQYVKNLDFKRYMGLWYTIAALPNAIQKNCKCSQTFDTLVSDLVIELAESCLIFGRNITSKSKAVATVNGYGNWTNVNGPISAPYWVIKVDENYQWSIIGQPSRKGFWIINRKPQMDQTLMRQLISWSEARGFNLKGLEYEDQSCHPHSIQQLEVKQNGQIIITDQ